MHEGEMKIRTRQSMMRTKTAKMNTSSKHRVRSIQQPRVRDNEFHWVLHTVMTDTNGADKKIMYCEVCQAPSKCQPMSPRRPPTWQCTVLRHSAPSRCPVTRRRLAAPTNLPTSTRNERVDTRTESVTQSD